MSCNNCNGPSNCCYTKAKEIKAYKKHVLSHFIFEVIFEMVISISSVVTDFLTLIIYLKRHKWVLALLTFIPVLLPTTVFTNVYLSDDKGRISLSQSGRSISTELCEGKSETECPQCEPTDSDPENSGRCRACCSAFCLSMCHKDKAMRKRAAGLVGKYLRRSSKYFFGTFVLRVIAWTWYLKALVFGYKAYRSPKRFMKLQSPHSHWSHELLLRLDFLQAALENAPQCVIQLYALLVDTEESKTLGILTLTFSFLDFIRVATTVHWNIQKGPVEAPENVYGSFTWRTLNMSSWILLYVARCCGIAVLVATSDSWGAVIAFGVFALHMCLFAKLFSSKKFGVAAQKILVTAFISLFFLPELDAQAVDKLIQFYYAILLMENTCFIIPWNGLDQDYCELFNGNSNSKSPSYSTTFTPKILDDEPFIQATTPPSSSRCFLQPELVVLVVASFTVMGVILRLAAARKLARYQATLTSEETSTTMEDKIANIYNKKWTNVTLNDLINSFLHMLKKEVIMPENTSKSGNSKALQKNPNCTLLISDQLASHFTASQNFIKKSFSMIIRSPQEVRATEENRRSSYCYTGNNTSQPKPNYLAIYTAPTSATFSDKSQNNNFVVETEENTDPSSPQSVPHLFFVPALPNNSVSNSFNSPSSLNTPL